MLIRFRASNFRSLRDEVELSMVASSQEDDSASVVPCEALGHSLLRVAAIYGANAAGKSNVLAAMSFMSAAVQSSHRIWRPQGPIPRQPFALDPKSAEPSLFEVDFLLDEVRYRYGFVLDSELVVSEWLYSYPKRRTRTWFIRDTQSERRFIFGRQVKGNNRAIEALTRRNSLFLSVAAENNHPTLSPIYNWFAQCLGYPWTGDRDEFQGIAFSTLHDAGHRHAFLQLLQNADLGVSGWTVAEKEWKQLSIRELMDQVREGIRRGETTPEKEIWEQMPYTIELKHRTKANPEGAALPFREESRGTHTWFALSGLLLKALDIGAVMAIDELDASLHPHLALEVVRIFQDPARNPKNAQLIFNTHDTNLLRSLRRDQIWFVEKDDGGATHLYPLTDFKPRKGENLERGYLQGRYGAIPFLGELALAGHGPQED